MENSQSQQASTNASVSTSHARKIYTNEDVVRIRPTTRKGDVWSNYDMCIMIDGVEKARCKKCMKFYNPGSNSTLRTHKSGCNAVSENDTSQGTIGADGQVFIFDNDAVRLDFTKFVIQQALPFNHFDNVKLTEIIKRRLQPRYQHVSRTTLRSDAFKLWETAKKDIIDGFRDYKYGVSITTDTWTAPHGRSDDESSTTDSEDEEYAMVVRDFKYPNHLLGDCLKPPKNKDQKAFYGGYCKDIGKKEEERNKEEACCIAIDTNEVSYDSSYYSEENSSLYDYECFSMAVIDSKEAQKEIEGCDLF
ncbi:hypothetical protein Tco_0402097 [Tanacetum coccineum]